jgi:thymidine kinase
MSSSSSHLELILGPMFAGKTTALMEEYQRIRYKENIRSVIINHSKDAERNNNNEQGVGVRHAVLRSHGGLSVPCIQTDNLSKEFNMLTTYDYIFINEGQFFKDLVPVVLLLLEDPQKHIYVCGLDGDFERKKIGTLLDLIPWCNRIQKLVAKCQGCGGEAIFTKRIDSTNKDQIVVGGKDIYHPVCRRCV